MPSRGIRVGCACALALLALAGCALQPDSGLSATQARTQFYSALDKTQEAVGGAWDVFDDPTARGCVIPFWIEGEKFPGLRIGPAPRDPQAMAQQVDASWRSWGYTVARSRTGDVIELQAHDKGGALLVFRASAMAMTLQGESECRPRGE
ncbi:hypothetical protein BH11ACT4_BH11ACT4_24420 [soil metagenome]